MSVETAGRDHDHGHGPSPVLVSVANPRRRGDARGVAHDLHGLHPSPSYPYPGPYPYSYRGRDVARGHGHGHGPGRGRLACNLDPDFDPSHADGRHLRPYLGRAEATDFDAVVLGRVTVISA